MPRVSHPASFGICLIFVSALWCRTQQRQKESANPNVRRLVLGIMVRNSYVLQGATLQSPFGGLT
jgi:hypothetical protein